ncbi:hypothetical protein JD844_010552 [Phrynosoma platyrhinos]|uniref:Lysozyme n=1 Tax=Phrynosoma platyrhinos TaxID=52577 RepID=A0ABQ7TH02_PHRPL|nr:hypothetical protein JD844_010552 [Phrynosoma platyrhinos]
MKFLLLLQLLMCLASRVWGKIFGRCELAQVLKRAGLEGYRGHTVADYLLTSNINDDIVCAMKIAQRPRSLGAW